MIFMWSATYNTNHNYSLFYCADFSDGYSALAIVALSNRPKSHDHGEANNFYPQFLVILAIRVTLRVRARASVTALQQLERPRYSFTVAPCHKTSRSG